ncbi:hypothetical protein ABFS83_11G075100 [Erythranthe nasuta]
MHYTSMVKQLLQSFILLNILIQSLASEKIWNCWPVGKVQITVFNRLPENTPPMLLHCQSRDDRLGYHTLAKDERFDFTFCPVWRTVFFCHVWWNGKDIAFDVYRWKRCELCMYEVRSDGIYEEKDRNYVKMRDW